MLRVNTRAMRFTMLVAWSVVILADANAADSDAFLNAEAWDMQYEFTFTAESKGSETRESGIPGTQGTFEHAKSLKRTLTASYVMDLRSGGPSLSNLQSIMNGKDPSKMNLAEIQQFNMEMISKMDHTANWMNGGGGLGLPDDASDEQLAAAVKANLDAQIGIATLSYTSTVKGTNQYTEMGTPYSSVITISQTGSGKVQPAGQITLEINTETQEYLLLMGYGFSDPSLNSVKVVEKRHFEFQGEAPSDTTITEDASLNGIGATVTIDEPDLMSGQLMMLKGKFDPATGVIKNVHTIKAHYADGGVDIPGTLLLKYTLKPR